MKKNIKILLIGIIVFAFFAGGVNFPSSVQADSSKITPAQQEELRKGILSWYYSKNYEHYPFVGEKVDGCEYIPGELFPSCICSSSTQCWKWTCPPGKEECRTPDKEGEEAISNYLETLATYEEFSKELSYVRYIENLGWGPSAGPGLIDSIGAYLNNLGSPEEEDLRKDLDDNIKRNEDVTEMNRGQSLSSILSGTIQKLSNLLIWSIKPSTYGGYTTNNNGVSEIWKHMRDFVNIGLIIAMVLMAVATILGIEKYSWKKTLWKIALVALLVNFSLVIVGMIVDLFNYFTTFFLNSAISALKGKSFGDLFTFQSDLGLGVLNVLSGFFKWLLSKLIILFVGILVIIILLVAFLAMIVRAIVIMFLAAISPLAFAAWIFPDTEKWWKVWWDNFLKWASFGLIFSISLYAGITIIGATNTHIISPDTSFASTMFTALMAAIFLLVGLIFSLQSGTAASQFILEQTGKIGGATAKWGGRKAVIGAEESAIYKKTGKIISRIPLLSGIGQHMMTVGAKNKAERIAKYQKELGGLSLTQLKELEANPLPSILDKGGWERKIALTNRLAELGKIGDGSVKFINSTMNEKGQLTEEHFDIVNIVKSRADLYKIEGGEVKRVEDNVDAKVASMLEEKPGDIVKYLKGKEIIKNIVESEENKIYNKIIKSGGSENEAKITAQKAGERVRKHFWREIISRSTSAQVGAFVQASELRIDDVNNIVSDISSSPTLTAKFNTHLRSSRVLREYTGLSKISGQKQPSIPTNVKVLVDAKTGQVIKQPQGMSNIDWVRTRKKLIQNGTALEKTVIM